MAGTRQTVRRLVADLGHPYLVLRFGMLDTDDGGPAHAPRLPADQIIAVRPCSGDTPAGYGERRNGGYASVTSTNA